MWQDFSSRWPQQGHCAKNDSLDLPNDRTSCCGDPCEKVILLPSVTAHRLRTVLWALLRTAGPGVFRQLALHASQALCSHLHGLGVRHGDTLLLSIWQVEMGLCEFQASQHSIVRSSLNQPISQPNKHKQKMWDCQVLSVYTRMPRSRFGTS